jgi:cytochrome c-type biogenesis protein CcmF
MIPEIGHLALVIALCLAAAQSFFGILGAQRANLIWMNVVRPAAVGQSIFVMLAFASLAYAFLTNDFSLSYVAANSNTALPWPYKFTAVWGAHEGSLLLWVFVLAIWTVAVARFSRHLPQDFSSRVLGVLGLISIGFLLFMLTNSDPFGRLLPPAEQGADLNPVLQDPGMAIHPPMLYMGYVGMSVAFAFAVAALLSGRMDVMWARWSRPWTLVAWLFLTCGITFGSWWSYYVLGWGGFWFWDPVENASFMPWLVGTALVHSLAVTEKRGAFKSWTALLAIAAFSLSLLGTFLVRSGILISVHAFASDPRRGIFILAMLGIFVGASLVLYAWRAPMFNQPGGGFKIFSRETFLLLNNVFLVVAAAAVLLGTLYPLALGALNLGQISVGPPYFDHIFVPLMLPFFILVGIGPYVRWKHGSVNQTLSRLRIPAALVLAAGVVLIVLLHAETSFVATAGVLLAAWTIFTALQDPFQRLWQRLHRRHVSFARSVLGMSVAHFGAGLMILGVTVNTMLGITVDRVMKPGTSTTVHGYQFNFLGVHDVSGPNYQAVQGSVAVTRAGKPVTVIYPEKRQFGHDGITTTEAAIAAGPFHDLYVALGNPLGQDAWSIRIEYKPLVRFIWLGGLTMMFGGFVALMDKRYRRSRVPIGVDVATAPEDADADLVKASDR